MIKPAVYAAIGLVLAIAVQTTGSVFGPGVTQGERDAEYRLGIEWAEAGQDLVLRLSRPF